MREQTTKVMTGGKGLIGRSNDSKILKIQRLVLITGLETKFQREIVNIYLPHNFSICFGCSKEPSY